MPREHTPTPWHVGPHYRSDVESREGRVAECGLTKGDRGVANAEFICRAVNSHEALVSALRRSLDWLASYPGGNAAAAYEEARKALSLVDEGRE